MRIFWSIYELVMITGAVVALRFMLININFLRLEMNDRISKLTDKGMARTDAIALVSFRRKNERLKAIGYGTIVFVFVYCIVDILFKHIIGG